jgi:hypothetical protein
MTQDQAAIATSASALHAFFKSSLADLFGKNKNASLSWLSDYLKLERITIRSRVVK